MAVGRDDAVGAVKSVAERSLLRRLWVGGENTVEVVLASAVGEEVEAPGEGEWIALEIAVEAPDPRGAGKRDGGCGLGLGLGLFFGTSGKEQKGRQNK